MSLINIKNTREATDNILKQIKLVHAHNGKWSKHINNVVKVWVSCTGADDGRLEQLQLEAAIIVTGLIAYNFKCSFATGRVISKLSTQSKHIIGNVINEYKNSRSQGLTPELLQLLNYFSMRWCLC
jgi:NADPH-dependent curcumin reductase CurA